METGDNVLSEIEAPEDKGGVVKLIFFLWGTGVLLPWNIVMNEYDFMLEYVSL